MLWHRRPLHHAASPLLEQLALLGCSSQSAVGKIKTVELAGPLRTVQRPLVIHADRSGLPQVTCKAPALRLPAVLQSSGQVLETPLSSTRLNNRGMERLLAIPNVVLPVKVSVLLKTFLALRLLP